MLKKVVSFFAASLVCLGANAGNLPADPTKPAPNSIVYDVKETPEQYVVSSLITGKKKNLAIVNGQRVHTGDLVDGAKVVAISRKGVHLEVSGEQQFISLTERKGFSKIKSVK